MENEDPHPETMMYILDGYNRMQWHVRQVPWGGDVIPTPFAVLFGDYEIPTHKP